MPLLEKVPTQPVVDAGSSARLRLSPMGVQTERRLRRFRGAGFGDWGDMLDRCSEARRVILRSAKLIQFCARVMVVSIRYPGFPSRGGAMLARRGPTREIVCLPPGMC